MSQRFRVGLPEVPPNTVIGVRTDSSKNEPPFAVTAKELGEILNSSAFVTETTSFSFDPATHNAQTIRYDSSANGTCTLLANSAVGTMLTVLQVGTGQLTFAADTGATVHHSDSLFQTSAQWAIASAFVESNSNGNTASWVVSGSLA